MSAAVTAAAPRGATGDRRAGRLAHIGLALFAYAPFLLSSPGDVAADTKQYLYLGPSRLLRRAVYMWDPSFGAGTVLHQNIGYLFPMGPYYWLMDQLGAPDWVAQRLWFGTVTFAAGAGVLFLLRTLGRRDAGAIAAAFVYMLSPYVLAYTARQSVILLPWAGLPWMIALAERSLRNRDWKNPALLALVVFAVGSTNATALLFAGIGPSLWIVFAVFVEHRVEWRAALAATARIGALVLLTALWWVVGLSVQSGYGIPVLDYTETVKAVAAASSPLEVLRGLGNWFFYGRDGLSEWITQSPQYQEQAWLLVASLAIPVLAFVAAALTRWRHRVFFVALVIVGTVIAVGTYPYDDPSPVGRVFKSFAEGSTVGLAMRSTPRAVPLVALGIAVLLGTGISALLVRHRRVGLGAAVVVGVLAVATLPPAWQTDYVGANLKRSEELPQYWLDAARYLDGQGHATRVLELPGADFSAYRWGNTVDPILPGLMDRSWVERELVPFGSQASADLLTALDRRLQEGIVEPAALAPVARLFAAGDVLLRYDLEYERYRTPRPRLVYLALVPRPAGLKPAKDFGPRTPNRASPAQPMLDALELGIPAGTADPPKVQVYGVEQAEPILRTAPIANPVIVAGDGEGLVDAAAAGIIDGRTVVLSSAWYAKHEGELRRLLAQDADLVVTDTNRRRARHWGATRDMTGYTEQAGERPLVDDPGDKRLEPFPGAGDDTQTVAIQRGTRSVQASAYGDPLLLTPENRPAMAFDGDVRTAWVEGAGADATGERLVVRFARPVSTDHLALVQPRTGIRDRYVTQVGLSFDGGAARRARLGPASRTPGGEIVRFPRRTFRELEVSIDAVESPTQGKSAVGFSEVRVGGAHVDEVIRMPVDLLRVAGRSSLRHRLTFLMTRLRGSQAEYIRTDEEPALVRRFDLPAGRAFALAGRARLDGRAPDEVLDAVLGVPDAAAGGVTARSSSHLEGDVRARAAAALDGAPDTAWTAAFGGNVGQWVDYELATAVTFDHLDLRLVADGRHSVPTRLRIEPEGASPFTVDVPTVRDRDHERATVPATVSFPEITTRRVRVTVEAVRRVTTTEYFSRTALELPVAIAEVGIPGVRMPAPPTSPAGTCRADLVTVDGRPVPPRVVGTGAGAVSRRALELEPCGGSASGLSLDAGDHEVRSAPGLDTAIDVDRLTLASDVGGAPRTDPLLGQSGGQHAGPRMRVTDSGRGSYDVRVQNPDRPFWLVLAQSHNDGWHAELDDGTSLGPPDLADGMANAWLVHPHGKRPLTIHLRWTPQGRVWLGLGVSAVGVVLCLVLALRRRRSPAIARLADDAPELVPPVAPATPRPSRGVLIGVPLGVAVVGALIAAPWVGVIGGAATLGGLLDRRLRAAVRLGAGATLAAAALYVIVEEVRVGYQASFDWPQRFLRVNDIPWLALVLLIAAVVIDHVLDRGRSADVT